MIKPEELRIGNILNYDTGEGIVPTVIGWQDIKWVSENPETFDAVHSLIPLTEEWLLKLGFTKWIWCNDCAFISLFFGYSMHCRLMNGIWHIKKMEVRYEERGMFGKSDGGYVIPKGSIRHVHQIQNLHFALTGKELTADLSELTKIS